MTADIRVNPPNEFIFTNGKEPDTKVSITYSTTGKPHIDYSAQIFPTLKKHIPWGLK